jgi:hypothetical protein
MVMSLLLRANATLTQPSPRDAWVEPNHPAYSQVGYASRLRKRIDVFAGAPQQFGEFRSGPRPPLALNDRNEVGYRTFRGEEAIVRMLTAQ